MAPKQQRKQQPQAPPSESSSDSGDDAQGLAELMDMNRFMNPNYSREFLAKLSPKVRARVHALQGLDKELKTMQDEHDQRIRDLARKYATLEAPLFLRRRAIVTGEYEPTDADVQAGVPEEHKEKVSLVEGPASVAKGLPGFWRTALEHHRIIEDMITERDAEALDHLIDITYVLLEAPTRGFALCFTFEPNEFFTNTTLSKTFFLKEMESAWALEKTEATNVEWKEGKNLTVETVTKKQKSTKKKGAVRYVTKTEPCESFFNLFKPMEDEEIDEQHYAMAETIKEKIIPFAVRYFVGEAPDGSSDMDDDEEMDSDEDGEDEDEDDEDDEPPAARGGRGGAGGRGGGAARGGPSRGGAAKGGAAAPDCKQQ